MIATFSLIVLFALASTFVPARYKGWSFSILLAAIYVAGTQIIGVPKPASLKLLDEPVTLVAAQFEEGVAIWLWVTPEGTREPRAYSIPWSLQVAKRLSSAQRQAEENGSPVTIRNLSRSDAEPVFDVRPPVVPPKK